MLYRIGLRCPTDGPGILFAPSMYLFINFYYFFLLFDIKYFKTKIKKKTENQLQVIFILWNLFQSISHA